MAPAAPFSARSSKVSSVTRPEFVIEIIDKDDATKAFRRPPRYEVGGGLVTLEKVQVLQYGADMKHVPA